jgi:phenylacetate-coenzyme A ligase PaaK-like adenylate-forming protein
MKLTEQIQSLIELGPFNSTLEQKNENLLNLFKLQVTHHIKSCKEYKNWFARNNFQDLSKIKNLEDIPFLPSAIFKHLSLKSNNSNNKQIQSSGTTSQLKSKIFLDTNTSLNQTKSLTKILKFFLGEKKKPFFIVDIEPKNSQNIDGTIAARFAGMSGYMLAAKSKTYLLEESKTGKIVLKKDVLKKLIKESNSGQVILIGYTYMIWQHLLDSNENNANFNLGIDTKLIHFGGWKKLNDLNISKKNLLEKIESTLNLTSNCVFDIYGFTEQLGTVYVAEGEEGCLVSDYSYLIVRDPITLHPVKDGEIGFLQFMSILPTSYPGFSILNDDLGSITQRKITSDGREIVKFNVLSRLEKAESRGCGDTLPDNFYI